jgi:hypothetical protein
MMKVKWTERITNEEVLRRVGEKRNIMNTLRRRRGRFTGYILRRWLIENSIGGGICGKDYWGRPRMEYVAQIMKDVKTKVGMKRLAENREDWRAARNQSLD